MYHGLVKPIAKTTFERVNQKDFDALLKDCVPHVYHRCGGQHPPAANATIVRRFAAGSNA
jgi:hypothetical protein